MQSPSVAERCLDAIAREPTQPPAILSAGFPVALPLTADHCQPENSGAGIAVPRGRGWRIRGPWLKPRGLEGPSSCPVHVVQRIGLLVMETPRFRRLRIPSVEPRDPNVGDVRADAADSFHAASFHGSWSRSGTLGRRRFVSVTREWQASSRRLMFETGGALALRSIKQQEKRPRQ